MHKYLIVNTGSASKKYSLFVGDKEAAFLHIETENGEYISTFVCDSGSEKSKITSREFEKSLDYLVSILIKKTFILSKEDIFGVGIRVVAPGVYFEQNHIIDKEFLKNIKNAGEKAPLHIEAISAEIKKLLKFFGKSVPIVGVSDSAFHTGMPDKSRFYAIPLSDSKEYEIYRYGYHGISLGSIVNKLKETGKMAEKMIVCHVGGGVSITALKNGKSIDTSMGFTPLEGMVMATRVGDIDSGAVAYLSEVLGLKGTKLRQYLNKKCGLLGLSGKSDDVRELFKVENENTDVKNALDIYAYRIQKQIGAYVAALGGLDLLVFSGTVGERSFKMRQRICNGLDAFGIKLDEKKNEDTDRLNTAISTDDSRIRVEVVKTNEMKQIAEDTRKILG
ncbi:MAG: acetate/propionate family kinase [Candidatus Paceibacterota bacterium]|jgi:acetate kinase